MSVQTETVPSGRPSGPGLEGLQNIPGPAAAAVNQSSSEPTAQHHHHGHGPYTSTYPAYSNLPVSYNPAYNPAVSIPTYYAHDASQSSHPTPGHLSNHDPSARHDQDARPHPPNHHEAMQSQIHTGGQQAAQELSQSEPSTDPQASVPYQPASPHDQVPNQPFAESSVGGSKRRYEIGNGPEDEVQTPRRQRQRMSVSASHTDTDMESTKEDNDVGPAGGPKHWTDDEKARLFHWLLGNDERWEAFGTKMNTIFREGSAQLYNSRKSFTALKSCYHRNLEIFKQMYVFEAFLARAPISLSTQSEAAEPVASTSTHDAAAALVDPNDVANLPTPASFPSATERQTFLERKLEAAKTLNVPVSNLSVKVIDHWFDMGWFALFKRRFQEEPKSGLPVPRYAADREGDDDAEGEDAPVDPEHAASEPTLQTVGTTLEARRRHLDPSKSLIPPPFPNPMAGSRSVSSSQRSHRASPPPASVPQPPFQPPQAPHYYSHSPQASPQMPYVYPHPPIPFFPPPTAADYQAHQQQQQQQLHFQMQTAQSLTQLTNMTQTLLGTCNTLVDLLKDQSEQIKAQTELLRGQEERVEAIASSSSNASQSGSRSETVGATDKAAAATELLANPRVTDDSVKRAAKDYLKRLFQ